MKVQRWEEILKRGVSGYVILLDVDGTLLPDGEREVSEKIKGYIETLKKDNKVYLLSNSGTKGRVGRVSSELNIPRLETPYKKPNPAIKRALPQNGMPILVIGDKLMIDGILAMLIGAKLFDYETGTVTQGQVVCEDRISLGRPNVFPIEAFYTR